MKTHFDFDSTLAVPTLPFEVLFFFFLAIPISCFALIYLCLAYCSFRISTSLRKKFNQIKGRGPRRRRAAGWPDLINNQKQQQQLQTKKYIFIAFYILNRNAGEKRGWAVAHSQLFMGKT